MPYLRFCDLGQCKIDSLLKSFTISAKMLYSATHGAFLLADFGFNVKSRFVQTDMLWSGQRTSSAIEPLVPYNC